jgi:hypothetical protein
MSGRRATRRKDTKGACPAASRQRSGARARDAPAGDRRGSAHVPGLAQAAADLVDADQPEIVAFETGLFNAQRSAGFLDLAARGGHGGAEFMLKEVLPGYFIGVNDAGLTAPIPTTAIP